MTEDPTRLPPPPPFWATSYPDGPKAPPRSDSTATAGADPTKSVADEGSDEGKVGSTDEQSAPLPKKSRNIAALVSTGIALVLAIALILVAIQKARIQVVTKTVTQTQYVHYPPLVKWGIGACAKSVSGGLVPVSCSDPYDWVVVSQVSNASSCIYYSVNGGFTSQNEYVPASPDPGYYCLVP
jgi:hypothetical protein